MVKTLVSTECMDRTEWLKWRSKGIGGSDAAIICGLSKYKSPIELWMEKTGQIEPTEAGEAAYWGNIMEPIIREEFTKRTGLEVGLEKSILQHPDFPFMLANLDGIIIEPQTNRGLIFEAKTASTYNANLWNMNIPENYQLQVQHYMAVTGFTGAYVAALIGGNEYKYFYIERDDELIKLLIKLEYQFWNCVVSKTPPKLDGSSSCTELMNKLYPKGTSKDILALPDDAMELIKQYETAQQSENDAAELKGEAGNKLKYMLGENEIGTVNGRIVYWSNVNAERLDTKTFKAEQPEIFAKYANKSAYRRFGIK